MKTLHKAMTHSRLKDIAPRNKRTAFCGEVVENTNVNTHWRDVNCKNCLTIKEFKAVRRKRREYNATEKES